MARLGIIFGLILFGISIFAMLQTPQKTPSQFYSMMFGIPIFFCGLVALNPHRRRHAMLIACMVAMFGVGGGLVWIALNIANVPDSIGTNTVSTLPPMVAMTATCSLFIGCYLVGLSSIKKRQRLQSTDFCTDKTAA